MPLRQNTFGLYEHLTSSRTSVFLCTRERAERVGDGVNDEEEIKGTFLGTFFGTFTARLQSAGMALLGHGWLWRKKGDANLARWTIGSDWAPTAPNAIIVNSGWFKCREVQRIEEISWKYRVA